MGRGVWYEITGITKCWLVSNAQSVSLVCVLRVYRSGCWLVELCEDTVLPLVLVSGIPHVQLARFLQQGSLKSLAKMSTLGEEVKLAIVVTQLSIDANKRELSPNRRASALRVLAQLIVCIARVIDARSSDCVSALQTLSSGTGKRARVSPDYKIAVVNALSSLPGSTSVSSFMTSMAVHEGSESVPEKAHESFLSCERYSYYKALSVTFQGCDQLSLIADGVSVGDATLLNVVAMDGRTDVCCVLPPQDIMQQIIRSSSNNKQDAAEYLQRHLPFKFGLADMKFQYTESTGNVPKKAAKIVQDYFMLSPKQRAQQQRNLEHLGTLSRIPLASPSLSSDISLLRAQYTFEARSD
eukprot:3284717-Amphidinium_carterae.2